MMISARMRRQLASPTGFESGTEDSPSSGMAKQPADSNDLRESDSDDDRR